MRGHPDIDYCALVRDSKIAQGLPPEVPDHIREVVAALMAIVPEKVGDAS